MLASNSQVRNTFATKHPRGSRFTSVTVFCKVFRNVLGYTASVSVAGVTGATSHSPLSTRTSSPPESSAAPQQQQSQQQAGQGSGQSPMAALMSVADNLPPGSPRSTGSSPPTNVAPRSASRGSQHSPNSTGV